MDKTIKPSVYRGEISAPPSKSYLQRAIAIAALGKTTCNIEGFAPSDDAEAAIGVARSLGARIAVNQNIVTVEGIEPSFAPVEINCGEAGLSTRMFSPIAALFDREVTITGRGSLLTRPMDMVVEALEQMGKHVQCVDNKLPLKLSGKMEAGELTIDGSESSQLLTGLLIALPLLEGDSVIRVKNLKSIPYVQMTLDILAHYGVSVTHTDFECFDIRGGQLPKADAYSVEGDWSGAAFHLVGGAIAGRVKVSRLNPHSAQADKAILDALRMAGAQVEVNGHAISVASPAAPNFLTGFDFDATHCPDLFPPLAVLAACCKGTTQIKGTNRLTHKESNRALTIQEELGKLGVQISLEENTMVIEGGPVRGGATSSRNDHRIAMAGATLALVADSAVKIENPDAVNKSYPGFYADLNKLSS